MFFLPMPSFANHRFGFKIPKNLKIKQSQVLPENLPKEDFAVLPSKFDWRDHVNLSPVKNQGNCGSCWAFSAVMTFQDTYKIVYGEEKNWSEQYLVSCNQENWGCDGGFWASDYHAINGKVLKGAMLDSLYPYTAKDDPCKTNLIKDKSIASWKYVSGNEIPTVEELKQAIYKYGVISVAVYADSAMSAYRGGIFSSCQNKTPNHAVNLVGWNDDEQTFTMKNSWGASWGENGYMRIKYNCSKIGHTANVVLLDKLPTHDEEPEPEPEPEPTPEPEPDPIYPDDSECEKIIDPDSDPDPDPDPNPEPDPEPNPDPNPCVPQPYANAWPDNLPNPRATMRGIIIGTDAKEGHSYIWRDYVGRKIATSAKIFVRPFFTTTYRLYASTKCGTASDYVNVYGVFRIGNFDLLTFLEPEKVWFAPENDAYLQDNVHKSLSGITEAEFNESIKQVSAIYEPLAKQHRAVLRISGAWNDNTVNAYTTRVGSNWIVQMFGGLSRREEITLDGFKLVICHELGHNFGGYPLMSSMMWPSAEGQSDYFASYACGRLLWGKEDNRGYRDVIPEHPKKLCDEAFKCSRDKDLCYRTMLASWSTASLLANLGGTKIAWDTPDPTIVKSTNPNHPNGQCRLDSYIAGNLCTGKKWKHSIIPISETQSLKYMCGDYSKGNARPKCWYKPIAE